METTSSSGTTSGARPQNDSEISLKDITINASSGLPTSASNPRGSAANGFSYTCSTYKDSTSGKYNYAYSFCKEAGDAADTIDGNTESWYTFANKVRTAKDTQGNEVSESVINVQNVLNASAQFTGDVTPVGKFCYNEGFSTTLANGEFDKTGTNPDNSTEYTITLGGAANGITFYDQQSAVFSDQLQVVRGMTEQTE